MPLPDVVWLLLSIPLIVCGVFLFLFPLILQPVMVDGCPSMSPVLPKISSCWKKDFSSQCCKCMWIGDYLIVEVYQMTHNIKHHKATAMQIKLHSSWFFFFFFFKNVPKILFFLTNFFKTDHKVGLCTLTDIIWTSECYHFDYTYNHYIHSCSLGGFMVHILLIHKNQQSIRTIFETTLCTLPAIIKTGNL